MSRGSMKIIGPGLFLEGVRYGPYGSLVAGIQSSCWKDEEFGFSRVTQTCISIFQIYSIDYFQTVLVRVCTTTSQRTSAVEEGIQTSFRRRNSPPVASAATLTTLTATTTRGDIGETTTGPVPLKSKRGNARSINQYSAFHSHSSR